MKTTDYLMRGPNSKSKQRGVVLLFSLIALVIMLIVAVALVRSFNNSLFSAGNIGFKRDLQNQSELIVQRVLTGFAANGNLATSAQRAQNHLNLNYSAKILDTNPEGIPNVLQDLTAFNYTAQSITSANGSVTIEYIIDRLCSDTGDENTMGALGKCRMAKDPIPAGVRATNQKGADRTISGRQGAARQAVLYRLSVKATGPRNTRSFFQSTFTVPSS